MKLPRHIATTGFSLAAIATIALAACGGEEEVAGPGHDEGEPEPAGVVIQVGGTTITADETSASGPITVTAGDETANFDVQFVDDDGNVLNIDEADFFAAGVSDDETIAEYHSIEAFRGHIEGHAEGSAAVVFSLMHPPGPDAHSNFDAAPITIDVVP